MTGAPIRSASKIINKFLKRNYTIVIIEQTSESPKPTREITQIITPSTYINEIENDSNDPVDTATYSMYITYKNVLEFIKNQK